MDPRERAGSRAREPVALGRSRIETGSVGRPAGSAAVGPGVVGGSPPAPAVPDQDREVEFVKLGDFYVNVRLSLRELAQCLWKQSDQFLGSEGKSRLNRSLASRLLPPRLNRGVQVARKLARFALARASSDGGEQRLRLPVGGEIARVRRSGAVKVLDLRRGHVFTVMGEGPGRQKLRDRIELARRIAHLPFAPGIVAVDLERGYFAEEFCSGSHPLDFAGCGGDFGSIYAPLLTEFQLAFEPRWLDAQEYVDRLCSEIEAPDGLLPELSDDRRRGVEAFVRDAREHLGGLRGSLPLVLSHGDYFSGNIVIDGERHRAIDWAHIGFRSPLHDLYYLFMNHCVRVLDRPALERRLNSAMATLRSEVASRDPDRVDELSDFLADGELLRWLFYLECVHVPMQRALHARDRYLESMLVRIDWFRDYEATGSGAPVEESGTDADSHHGRRRARRRAVSSSRAERDNAGAVTGAPGASEA